MGLLAVVSRTAGFTPDGGPTRRRFVYTVGFDPCQPKSSFVQGSIGSPVEQRVWEYRSTSSP
jgi:hypothetical protein